VVVAAAARRLIDPDAAAEGGREEGVGFHAARFPPGLLSVSDDGPLVR
jgi:hypothetical protein